jgi:hypothetical protein
VAVRSIEHACVTRSVCRLLRLADCQQQHIHRWGTLVSPQVGCRALQVAVPETEQLVSMLPLAGRHHKCPGELSPSPASGPPAGATQQHTVCETTASGSWHLREC